MYPWTWELFEGKHTVLSPLCSRKINYIHTLNIIIRQVLRVNWFGIRLNTFPRPDSHNSNATFTNLCLVLLQTSIFESKIDHKSNLTSSTSNKYQQFFTVMLNLEQFANNSCKNLLDPIQPFSNTSRGFC